MANLRQLKKQIKFSLDNLRANNAHHDFESICRHFARKRLGLNILPATGPVSAKGDQGKDFETYRIIPEVIPEASKKSILLEQAAFACTIQSSNLNGKVKKDVNTILTEDESVKLIYFFSVTGIPVGKRHLLQKWAYDTHKVQLEIFDGEALSEEFIFHDLFWIAEEYLHIPAELFPQVENLDYLKLKEKWNDKKPVTPNYAEFGELKGLARRAFSDEGLNQDLIFWLKKLVTFSQIHSLSSELKRKALYEIVALRIRGMKNLFGWEQYVYEYFDADSSFNTPIEAQEAYVVLTYAFGSFARGASQFDSNKLKKWRNRINSYTENLLDSDHSLTEKATLYELKGSLILTDPNSRDLDEGLEWWLKLTKLIEKSPLFPLERFSDILTVVTQIAGDHPKFDELTTKIDALLGERVGKFAIAEKCRDRALEYRKKGELLKSLREFHKTKLDWFAQETLDGSLLSMLVIAETYFELGLLYAAKYYAMSVTFIVNHSSEEDIKSFFTKGLYQLSEIEYANGEWAHALEHVELTLKALGVFSKNLDDPVSRKIYDDMLFHSSTIIALTNILATGALPNYVQKKIITWQLEELNDNLIPLVKEELSKVSSTDLIDKVKSTFWEIPFSDVGSRRRCNWHACGINWKIEWENGFYKTARAEHFICLLQIILADIADKDLYLLKTDAEVTIVFGESFHIERMPSNDLSAWSLTLPSKTPSGKEEINEYHRNILSIVTAIIFELSLKPDKVVEKEIIQLFKQGLTAKAFAGNSYEIVFSQTVSKELYKEIITLPKIDYLQPLMPQKTTHESLSWKDGLIKEYTQEEELDKIQKRYERSIVPIRKTLQLLNKHERFKKIVTRLKADNWKDWHILMAISQIALNYRMHQRKSSGFDEKIFYEELNREESEKSIPVPLSIFTEKSIRDSLCMTLPSTLKILGLEVRADTPNMNAILHFLKRRVKYWDNDVEHEQFFEG